MLFTEHRRYNLCKLTRDHAFQHLNWGAATLALVAPAVQQVHSKVGNHDCQRVLVRRACASSMLPVAQCSTQPSQKLGIKHVPTVQKRLSYRLSDRH